VDVKNCSVTYYDSDRPIPKSANNAEDFYAPCYWKEEYYKSSNQTGKSNIGTRNHPVRYFNPFVRYFIGFEGEEKLSTGSTKYIGNVSHGCHNDTDGYATCDFEFKGDESTFRASAYGGEERLGYNIIVSLFDYNVDKTHLYPMANAAIKLPSQVSYDVNAFGRKGAPVNHVVDLIHKADEHCNIDNESCGCNITQNYGQCSIETQFFPVKCKFGEYLGADSCRECEPGFYCNDGVQMRVCDSGEHSGAGATSCSKCPVGWSNSNIGSAFCEACAPGTYSSRLGSVECIVCTAGRFGAGGSYSSDCDGECLEGYYCPSGSVNSTMRKCSDSSEVYCPAGSMVEMRVPKGHYVFTDDSRKTNLKRCVAGSYCVNGVMKECPDMQYQNQSGQDSCLSCVTCGKGSHVTDCGGNSSGVCTACKYTFDNRLDTCGAESVIGECSGTTETDTSVCYDCLNSPDISEDASEYNTNWHTACDGRGGSQGVAGWMIGVIVAVLLVLFGIVLLLILKRRKQMRAKMADLDRKNICYEDESELASQLAVNVNPIFNMGSKIDPQSQVVHDKHVKELNQHKDNLESELRRMKMEKQINEADKLVHNSNSSSKYTKKTKKQFDLNDLAPI